MFPREKTNFLFRSRNPWCLRSGEVYLQFQLWKTRSGGTYVCEAMFVWKKSAHTYAASATVKEWASQLVTGINNLYYEREITHCAPSLPCTPCNCQTFSCLSWQESSVVRRMIKNGPTDSAESAQFWCMPPSFFFQEGGRGGYNALQMAAVSNPPVWHTEGKGGGGGGGGGRRLWG